MTTDTTALIPTAIPPRLFEVLEQEVALSEEMVALLEEEQKILVAMDVQGLLAVTRRKNNLLQRIHAADALLQEMISQLLATDHQTTKATLARVILHLLPGVERDRLAALRQQLLGLREKIMSKNTVNRHFAEDTQRCLSDAISLITNALAENHDTYQKGGNPGRRPPSANRPSLISRAV